MYLYYMYLLFIYLLFIIYLFILYVFILYYMYVFLSTKVLKILNIPPFALTWHSGRARLERCSSIITMILIPLFKVGF